MTSDRKKRSGIRIPKRDLLPPCPYTVNERWSFLDMAAEKAEESKCDRSKVGAALVRPDGKLIHVACNEVSPGHGDHTCKDFCPRGAKSYDELPTGSEPMDDCNSLHAEAVAVRYALEVLGIGSLPQSEVLLQFKDFWMFITKEPCKDCKEYLQKFGIRFQFATSWQRKAVREGVLVVAKGEGFGNSSGSANNADKPAN